MLSDDERRKFPRVPTKCEITYRENSKNSMQQGEVIDLSASGLLFQINQPLTVGTILEISVIPETKITPSLNATIEVKRVTTENNLYKVAAEIKQIK